MQHLERAWRDRGGGALGAAIRWTGQWVRRAADAAADSFLAERERWPLWFPVGLGVGVGLYFLPRAEPPLWLGLAVGVACASALAIFWRRTPAALVLLAAASIALGFSAAQWRAYEVAAPILERRVGPVDVTGRVRHIDVQPKARRVVLDTVTIAGLAPARTPARVRVRLHRGGETVRPGQRLVVRAILVPPPGPVAPGAFDFQRWAYFHSLGAVGFALGPARRMSGEVESSWRLRLAALRHEVNRRILAGLDGAPGAIAAALMTGERRAIPEQVLSAVRNSGLAHLLAISGLHIGLVAGILFFGVRTGLALVPTIALRYPVKKWAAVAALIGALAYVLIAGATVPTQRAYVMVGIVLLGVLLDRLGLSMRLVAWAAAVVLLISPESLMSASFQMSFGAVVALIAVYEIVQRGPVRWRVGPPWWRWPAVYLAGIALTTIVAALATGPFAVYHFNRLAVYGIAANLVAVPLTALWIMPWALVTFTLMPFGLEAWALMPMGWGVEALIAVARTVAAWPGSVALLPAMPAHGLALTALGGLWLCLWRRKWRLAGVPVVLAGLATVALVRAPDILVSGDGRLLAVRAADGKLMLSSRRAARFSAEMWLRRAGQREAPLWPREGTSADGRITCDSLGCIYKAGGEVVALVRDSRALAEDCLAATIVLSIEPARLPCPSARLVIDRYDLWRNYSYALWLNGDGVRIRNARESRGERPWVPKPEKYSKRARRASVKKDGRRARPGN